MIVGTELSPPLTCNHLPLVYIVSRGSLYPLIIKQIMSTEKQRAQDWLETVKKYSYQCEEDNQSDVEILWELIDWAESIIKEVK